MRLIEINEANGLPTQALETDLTKLFELAQETISDFYKLVLKSPVGLLLPRRGGECVLHTENSLVITTRANAYVLTLLTTSLYITAHV